MTVHARGYRPYLGALSRTPGWWVILSEGIRVTSRTRGMRVLGVLFLLWTVFWAVALYLQVGSADALRTIAWRSSHGESFEIAEFARKQLLQSLAGFYGGVTGLVSLLAIFTGAGLVSEDLKVRALTLYLVRPITAFDYALGKALVVPWVLVTRTALPGAAFWLLTGAWLPPGQTLGFWQANLDVLELVLRYTLLASGLYGGLLMLLSAGTSRRGVVSALAAAVLFGGMMLYGIATRMRGAAGDALRLVGLPIDAVSPFLWEVWSDSMSGRRRHRGLTLTIDDVLPRPEAVAVLAGALFLAGLLRVWWRARTVEVVE